MLESLRMRADRPEMMLARLTRAATTPATPDPPVALCNVTPPSDLRQICGFGVFDFGVIFGGVLWLVWLNTGSFCALMANPEVGAYRPPGNWESVKDLARPVGRR